MVIMKMLINYLLRSRGRVDGVFVRPRRRDAVDATLYAVRLLDGVAVDESPRSAVGDPTTSTPSSRRLDGAIAG